MLVHHDVPLHVVGPLLRHAAVEAFLLLRLLLQGLSRLAVGPRTTLSIGLHAILPGVGALGFGWRHIRVALMDEA